MRRWFDSLYARVLMMQALVALLTAALFSVLTLRHQASVLAHATAPAWASALRTADGSGSPAQADQTVEAQVPVILVSGPPPVVDTPLLLLPRLHVLQMALQEAGVPVRALRVSGRTGDSVVWLALDRPDEPTWVGVRSELEGEDVRSRGSLGFVVGTLLIIGTAWWLTRRVVRPLADLRLALQRFQAEGLLTELPLAAGPAEIRDLSAQFTAFARQRRDLDSQRRTMLAGISHDLRSPLARIRMAAEFLPGQGPLGARREAIVRNVQTVDRMLGAFIDMARAEEEPLNQRVDLALLLQGLQDDPAFREAHLLLRPPPSNWFCVAPANAAMLESALRNLVDNGLAHGCAPVHLELLRDGAYARLAVPWRSISRTWIDGIGLPFPVPPLLMLSAKSSSS